MRITDTNATPFYLRNLGLGAAGPGGEVLALKAGSAPSNTTCYMTFYARGASPTAYSGLLGYSNSFASDLIILNAMTGGGIVFFTNDSTSVNNRWLINPVGHLLPFGNVYDLGAVCTANRVRGIYANTGDFAGAVSAAGGISMSGTNSALAMGEGARVTANYGALQNVQSGADVFAMLWNAVYDWSGSQYKFQNTNSQGASALLLGNDRQLQLVYKAGPATAGNAFSWDAVGLGCALMARDVLEKVRFEAGVNMTCRDALTHNEMFVGECGVFGNRVAEMGIAMYMCGEVVCGHLRRDSLNIEH